MTKHEPDRADVILDEIVDFTAIYGHAPSVRDLMELTGLASTSAVHYHLKSLEKAGLVRHCQCGCGRVVAL